MSYAQFPTGLVHLSNHRISTEDGARQQRSAEELLRRLEHRPGVVLADEVGMGKTFVALAVAVSVVHSRSDKAPVVVMVPPSLKEKWPRDWDVFKAVCLDESIRDSYTARTADSGLAFLRLLDDPPEQRARLIFLTHGALHRSLSDGWAKLALIARAFKNRRSLAEQRANFPRFAPQLLRMGDVERRFPGLLAELLERSPEVWRSVVRRRVDIEGVFPRELSEQIRLAYEDDPIPQALIDALATLEGSELDPLVDALRAIPLRASANIEDRLLNVRRAIADEMVAVWHLALRKAHFSSPLLVLDEAHHLKNPGTRLVSLFVDEEAAAESEYLVERGPLGGRFERMMFLTATPFQLGHRELINVLKRFEGIAWRSRHKPLMDRAEFKQQLDALETTLDEAQASALRLDRAWGKLTATALIGEDGRPRDVDEWWGSVRNSIGEDLPGQVAQQVKSTSQAMKAAEKALSPWVLRHLKSNNLPGCTTPRRESLPGASILDGGSKDHGLLIESDVLLPFLLAGRAQALLASTSRGRALFAEGLASSFEAYRDTRRPHGVLVDHEEPDETESAPSPEIEWYLEHLDQALGSATAAHRAHPKIRATADRAVHLWRAGEKVLIFCHYRATGRALRQHISARLNEAIVDLAREKMPGVSNDRILEELERLGASLFGADSRLRREASESLERVAEQYREFSRSERVKVADVIQRFLRTPSFLARYFPLNMATDPEGLHHAFKSADASGLTLLDKVESFYHFLATRPEERARYLDALDRIQTGGHSGREVESAFDPQERRGEPSKGTLVANVRLANGDTRQDTRQRLLLAFNTLLFPEILIASSVFAEGVDLHLNCRHVIHHDLCWNPSTLEQRSGRVDRIGCKAELVTQPIQIYLPYVAATQDEKMYRVVRDRERWFNIVLGEQYEPDEVATDRRSARVELPGSVQRELSLKLHAEKSLAHAP